MDSLYSEDIREREQAAKRYRLFPQQRVKVPDRYVHHWKALLGDRALSAGDVWPEEIARLARMSKWPEHMPLELQMLPVLSSGIDQAGSTEATLSRMTFLLDRKSQFWAGYPMPITNFGSHIIRAHLGEIFTSTCRKQLTAWMIPGVR